MSSVVVSSAYLVSYQAPPVVLTNGWIVTCNIYSGNSIQFQVSKDNGATFTNLCYITGSASALAISMTSLGNIVYLVFSSTVVQLYKFDGSTVVNGPLTGTTITSALTSFGYLRLCCSPSGVLMVVGSGRNTAYPYGNIIFLKSTDGGVTWTKMSGAAGFDQITTSAGSNQSFLMEEMIINTAGNPVIVTEMWTGSGTYGYIYYWNGSAWATAGLPNSTNGYVNGEFCFIQKKNGANIGRIWLVWSGEDSTYGAYYHLAGMYSDDNGVTWSALIQITTGISGDGQQTPSLGEKPNGDIIVLFCGGNSASNNPAVANLSYRVCANGGITWSATTVLVAALTCLAPALMIESVNNYSGFMYQNSSSVQFDKFLYNNAPSAPTLNAVANFDATKVQPFTWIFSDPDSGDSQTAYQAQIIRVSDGVTVMDTGQATSTAGSYSLPANTLVNGIQYQWRIRTWDTSNAAGPYSSLGTFSTALSPTVTITSPVTDGTVITTNQVVSGFTFHSAALTQAFYQVRLTDNSDLQLWSSGKVSGTNSLLTISYALLTLTNYKIKVTVWDTYGLVSTEVVRLFSTSFTSPPIPIITVTSDNIRSSITLGITNPVPTGSQPAIAYNDVYRMASNETTWTRIATGVMGSYIDYTPMHNLSYQYKVTAVGVNTSTIDSNIIASSIAILYVQIANTTNYNQFVMLRYYDAKVETVSKPKASMQFSGREYPVSEFGEHSFRLIPLVFHINNVNDLNTLRSLVDSEQILLYRDNRGRKIFCTIDTLVVTDQNPNYYDVTANTEQVSYTEVV